MVKKVAAKKAMIKKVVAKKVEVKSDRFDWRSLYLYAVCLITLLVCLFSLAGVFKNLVGLIYPDLGYIDTNPRPANEATKVLANQVAQAHRNAIRGIIDSLTMLIIAAPLYLYHWRQVQADRK